MSEVIRELVEALRCLPGIGPKSAQRMAYHMLQRGREGGERLSRAIDSALHKVGRCQRCRTLSENPVCHLCANDKRDSHSLCIVETPTDVLAIEQATHYSGQYFVLMGRLSPLDGIGPEELGLSELSTRLQQGEVRELIIATNPTVEGEATAHYLSQMAHDFKVPATRIAHGVPLGGELEYIDNNTLAHAFAGRLTIKQ